MYHMKSKWDQTCIKPNDVQLVIVITEQIILFSDVMTFKGVTKQI